MPSIDRRRHTGIGSFGRLAGQTQAAKTEASRVAWGDRASSRALVTAVREDAFREIGHGKAGWVEPAVVQPDESANGGGLPVRLAVSHMGGTEMPRSRRSEPGDPEGLNQLVDAINHEGWRSVFEALRARQNNLIARRRRVRDGTVPITASRSIVPWTPSRRPLADTPRPAQWVSTPKRPATRTTPN